MIREKIKNDLADAVKKLGVEVGEIELTRTTDVKLGDFSTNIALKIRREINQSPMEIAKKIADSIGSQPYIDKLDVKEPGFINVFVKREYWQDEVVNVLNAGDKYGSNEVGKGKKARVEFVSANPTGPLHFGNARGGPIGDVLASVLAFSGYDVIREYYHNDLGGQVEKLGDSIINVANGGKAEDQEYKGEYVSDLAKQIGKVRDSREAGQKAVEILLKAATSDSADLGIEFDKVYAESELINSGKTKSAIEELEKKGDLKKKNGAIWFAPSDEFLKDRETVVVKSDGNYTYFANDIAYHDLKFSENPDLVIDVFGANHHGHVPRLQAAILALGYDERKFHVILYQWVRFKSKGEVMKMSKRAGTFVTAREVLDEIGRDALRFFILTYDPSSPIDFDLDLAKEKSNKNPVYYVQYAHARISSILSKAQRQTTNAKTNYELLTTNYELDLIKQITRLPELVEDISRNFSVHQLTTYARGLADSFHLFYENCRVIGEKKELEEARIALITATKIALENALMLLGISAPDKM
jgi:arginyl-tRNA synthetase